MSMITNLLGRLKGVEATHNGNNSVYAARDHLMGNASGAGLTFKGALAQDEVQIGAGNFQAKYAGKMEEYYRKHLKSDLKSFNTFA